MSIACASSPPVVARRQVVARPVVQTSAPAPRLLEPAMGSTLSVALGHEFFQFFGWTEMRRERIADGSTRVDYEHHPESDFAGLARLRIWIDAEDRILAMELDLSRAFTHGSPEHPTYPTFARDAAKSFLLAAMPRSAETEMRALSHELWMIHEVTTPSDGLRAYAGILRSWTSGPLHIESIDERDGEWVRMTVRP